jgi:hypothetical protein
MEINCNHCGKVFNKKPYAIKAENYCSKECRHSAKYTLLNCDMCGKEFEKLNTIIFKNNFCSRECSSIFTSQRMTAMNIELNPTRMTIHLRLKLRKAKLKTSKGCKSYRKFLGRHLHRIVAEETAGRDLIKGEVVHHLDENILNNNPDNLEILPSQAEHAKTHMNIRYGKNSN